MEKYCLFCIDYRNKRYAYYLAVPELILKEHNKLVNNMVLLKYNRDEIYSVAAALNSTGYKRWIM